MHISRLFLVIVVLSITGCFSYFGGGKSFNKPLEMKTNISGEARKLMDNAFNVGSPIVDQHLHLIGDRKPIGELTQELRFKERKICPNISFEEIPNMSDSNTSAWINEERFEFFKHFIQWFKTKVLMNTMKIKDRENADVHSIMRLFKLVKSLADGEPNYKIRVHILAVDGHYNKIGDKKFDETKTDMLIPNWYVIKLAECLNEGIDESDPFIPVISINPYKANAVEELTELKENSKLPLRYIKWVAPVMGFDPSKKEIDPFYEKVKDYGMVIMSHTGGEHAFEVKDESFRKYGNPLLMKRALDKHIPVILSHAGGDDDATFFEKLFFKRKYKNHARFNEMILDEDEGWCLFGDISALTIKKNFQHFKVLFGEDAKKYKYRILYGSDYPLPAMAIVYPVKDLISDNFLYSKDENNKQNTYQLKKHLDEIFSYNPLAFDVTVKRNITVQIGKKRSDRSKPLPKEVFLPLEENIKREMEDLGHQPYHRKQCHIWYKKFVKSSNEIN